MSFRWETHINVVVKLDASRAVKFNLFEGLSHDVVGLVFGLLSGLQHGSFVDVALVLNVKPAKSILQAKDLVLLELWIFPVTVSAVPIVGDAAGPSTFGA